MTEIDQGLQRLTNAVLAGKVDEARQSTYYAIGRGATINDVLDGLVECVNILLDLYEVGEYGDDRLNAAENAIRSSLQVIEDKLAMSEAKFNVKATIGPVGLRGGHLMSLVLSAVLRSAGFHVINLNKTQTALELLRNSEELGVGLVMPLLPEDRIKEHLQEFAEEVERGGFKTKFEIIPMAPGLDNVVESPFVVAKGSAEAISKATEWALRKQVPRKNE